TLVTHPDGSTEQFAYDRLDLVAAKDRAGRWTRTPHDAIRRPIATIAPDMKMTRYDWCSCGSLYKLTDPAGRVTEWKRDILGRVTEKVMPDGVTKTSYSYQPRSARLASMTRPNQQGGGSPTVRYRYLVDGRLQKEDYTDNSAETGAADVTYTYEPGNLGRLLTVADGIGTHGYSYRAFGDAGAGAVEYVNGPLTNDRVQFVHDWQDRVSTEKLLNDGDATELRGETHTWDSLGRPASIASTLGTFTFGYLTALSRPDSLARPGGLSSAFAYKANDAAGNSARALESITHTLAGTPATTLASHSYGYDPAGRITSWQTQGAGMQAVTRRFGHNLGDELIRSEKKRDSDAAVLDQEQWALDAAGNWLSKSTGSAMETRTHNVMNRLMQTGGAGSTMVEGTLNEFASVTVNGQAAALQSDPASGGYRFRRTLPVTEGSNTVTISAIDQDNETTTQSWQFSVPGQSRSFSYDANGNTLSDGQRTMTWDVKNRLRTVTKGGTTWKWDYDHQDRRVKEYQKVGSGAETLTKIFIWSGTNIVQERDAANTITRTHYSGGFSDGATPASGTKYQLLTDLLGHVREIIASNGTLATRYDYTSYQGPVKVSGTVDATFQTIGRYYHHAGSGLELALYRPYDSELGRWSSEDPTGEEGGTNLFRFNNNSPLGNVDVLGLVNLNLISPQQIKLWQQLQNYNPKGVYSVAGHAACNNPIIDNRKTSGKDGPALNARQLYRLIVANGYPAGSGMPIILVGCETGCGDSSIASLLAQEAQAPVGGPSQELWPDDGCSIFDEKLNIKGEWVRDTLKPGYVKWFGPDGKEIGKPSQLGRGPSNRLPHSSSQVPKLPIP
ncbi:MAG: RHS repeat-associated core domain-containing protein, partial [Fimbriimonadaceae bacterium]